MQGTINADVRNTGRSPSPPLFTAPRYLTAGKGLKRVLHHVSHVSAKFSFGR